MVDLILLTLSSKDLINILKLKTSLQIGASLIGDPDLTIKSFKSLEEASENDLSLILEEKYIKSLQSNAIAYITHKKIESLKHQLICNNPRKALALTITLFYPKRNHIQSNNPKPIDDSATIKTNAIGHYVSIGQHGIDQGSTIMNNVYTGKNCKIGDTV